MTLHSKTGGSSMHRWAKCPGSVRLSEGITPLTSPAAEEGTLYHGVGAKWLTSGFCPTDGIYDEDMLEAVKLYVDTVREDSGQNPILVEIEFDLSKLCPGSFGTADAVVYDPISKLLRVYDYKHGQGIPVEVHNNEQMLYYSLGAALNLNVPISDVEAVIVQPRLNHVDGPVRRWRFKALELVEFSQDLVEAVLRTQNPEAKLLAGDHCRFCPAAGICPELNKKSMELAKIEFKPALSYDPMVLAQTLSKIEMLENYAKSVKAFSYAEAEHGRCPPGFKLVDKRPIRKWKPDVSAEVLAQAFGQEALSFFELPEIKSPAQVEKVIPKSLRPFIREFTDSISSGMTLVEDSDPRPSALKSPELEFSKIGSDCG